MRLGGAVQGTPLSRAGPALLAHVPVARAIRTWCRQVSHARYSGAVSESRPSRGVRSLSEPAELIELETVRSTHVKPPEGTE
jgi:hypothetical protein